MQHFISTVDWSRQQLQAILNHAEQFKQGAQSDILNNKSIALLFFNPSMRTRTSFEIGTYQMGGHAVILEPGKSSWPLAFEFGEVMTGEAEEHIAEAARVLSRYCDLIGIRAFPKFIDWQQDKQDLIIKSFAQYATVPVMNMETITHPCQELAHMQAIQQHIGEPQNKKYLLTWTYHPKPLNTAVANSALLIASKFGMDITLLCPNEDYLLDQDYLDIAQQQANQQGGSLTISHNIQQAYQGADIVYAKSWGALPFFGRWEQEQAIRDQYRHFIVDQTKMQLTNQAKFSHCLPLRRNVKATDQVMDADYCIAIDEAENRLHVQKALMSTLIKQHD